MGQGIEITSTPLSEDVVKEQESKTELQELCEETRTIIEFGGYYPRPDSIKALINKALELEEELARTREQIGELSKLLTKDCKYIDKLVRYIKVEAPWQEVIIASTDSSNNPCWKIIPRGELEDELEELGAPPKEVFIFANPLRIVEKKIYDIEVNSDVGQLIEEIYE